MRTSSVEIRITSAAWDALLRHHRSGSPVERASVALGRVLCHGNRRIILIDVPGIALLHADDYEYQHSGAVRVKQDVTRRLMWWFAQSDYDAFVSIHDHWFCRKGTRFSAGDDRDDLRQDRYLRGVFVDALNNPVLGNPKPLLAHVALVFDQSGFDARAIESNEAKPFQPITRVAVVCDQLLHLKPNSMDELTNDFDASLLRHRDFITPAAQLTIGGLRVGIIGCGGLGPIVAENLLRMGVRAFALFDPDNLDETNLNRWLSGRRNDIGKCKVELLAQRLRECEPGVSIETYAVDVVKSNVISAVGACDVLVAAVDNDAARLWLNRVANASLVPIFDIGVRVRTSPKVDFLSRIVPVIPGMTACLECSPLNLLDHVEIAKSLDGLTASVRAHAGYVSDLDVGAPSVMGINTQAGGAVSLDLLAFVAGLNDRPSPKISTWSTSMITVINRDSHLPTPDCVGCGAGNRARGVLANVPTYKNTEQVTEHLNALFASI